MSHESELGEAEGQASNVVAFPSRAVERLAEYAETQLSQEPPKAATLRSRPRAIIREGVRYVLGSELPALVQAAAKRKFVKRYTGDHTPEWAMRSAARGCSGGRTVSRNWAGDC